MDAIAATVSAQIDGRLAQQEPTPDVEALQTAILAAVEERLAAASPESLAKLVDDTVASRLAEQQQAEEPGVHTALLDLYQKANSAVVYIVVPPIGSGSGFWDGGVGHIPAGVTALPVGAGAPAGSGMPVGALEVRTDFGTPGYGGPCPPPGSNVHRYIFTVFAVGIAQLPVTATTSAALVGFQLHMNTLDKARLIGLYRR